MPAPFIDHVRKFVPLSDAEANSLLEFVEFATVKKKEMLVKEGKVCTGNYFVLKGCLRSYFLNDLKAEQITQFAIENWWLSDYMSYETGRPSSFFIQAIEPSEVLIVRRNMQDEMFETLPQMERYFRIIIQKAYAASQMRIRYIYGMTGKERYLHFSNLFPEFIQRIPQYMLASYLGFSAEFLSKIRAAKS
jgi:CRP-like cAMP-binding protein